jgi:hypothetical protein
MKNNILIILIVLLNILEINAQKSNPLQFELKKSRKKYAYAEYNCIKYFDVHGSSNFGEQALGEEWFEVTEKLPLGMQISDYINSCTDSSAKKTCMVFELQKLYFKEKSINQLRSETICKIRANTYKVIGSECYRMNRLDTTIKYNLEGETSYMLLRAAAIAIEEFITQSLFITKVDTLHFPFYIIDKKDSVIIARQYIKDSLEKKGMPAYTNTKLKDGAYYNFESFKTQISERKCIVDTIDAEGTSKFKYDFWSGLEINKHLINTYKITIVTENGLEFFDGRIPEIAVINGDAYYYLGDGEYVKLQKVNQDFYFVKVLSKVDKGKRFLKGILNSGGYRYPFTGIYQAPLMLGNLLIGNTTKEFLMKLKLDPETGTPVLIDKKEVE